MAYDFELKKEWGIYAGFVPNKRSAVYNWFYYKEGFSREIVLRAAEMLGLKKGTVLDPFCGSGTTLLACRETGLDSIGYDVAPAALLASRVKSKSYDSGTLGRIRAALEVISKQKFERQKNDAPSAVRKFFSGHNLQDLLFLREMIKLAEDPAADDFLRLAMINAAMKCSWAWKDGGVIKVRKGPRAPLKKMFFRVAKRMIKEAGKFPPSEASAKVQIADARFMPPAEGSVDGIITSPPYLNQIDYTKVYVVENWIAWNPGASGERQYSSPSYNPPMRSFIGLGAEEADLMPWLPPQASAYFRDMQLFLEEAYRVCRVGAGVAIILGNAYFPPPHAPVECDSITAGLAEKAGFEVEKIIVLNQRVALRKRTEKVGSLRESMILMRK